MNGKSTRQLCDLLFATAKNSRSNVLHAACSFGAYLTLSEARLVGPVRIC